MDFLVSTITTSVETYKLQLERKLTFFTFPRNEAGEGKHLIKLNNEAINTHSNEIN